MGLAFSAALIGVTRRFYALYDARSATMQIVLPLIVGALTGALLGIEGFIPGALIGYLLWAQQDSKKRQKELETQVQLLTAKATLGAAPPAASKPAPQPAAAVEAPDTIDTALPVTGEPTEAEPVPPPLPPQVTAPSESAAPEPAAAPTLAEERPRVPLPEESVSPPRDVLAPLKALLFGGNPLVRVGVVVLFFGFAFLVKYAVDNDIFPIELRLAATALAGIALTGLGWRLREKRPDVGLAMQGGGVGVLYLSIFAAFRLYELIPSGIAFGLLVAVAVLTALVAVLQNAQSLAVLALLCGFFAPVLASTGEGSHVALFSYYLVLNAAVVAIAWFKPWRPLNLVGFFCTFGIAGLWMAEQYEPAFFRSTEPFLILFFLIYFGVALLHARHRLPKMTNLVDGTLVFGLPVFVFGLQAVMMEAYAYGLAWSAFGFGLFYVVAAWLLYQRAPETIRMLVEAFAGIGIAMATMILPFAADATWTGTGWALEGAALVWLGVRQKRLLVRLAGYVLQLAAAGSFIVSLETFSATWPVLNPYFCGMIALSVSALFTAYYVQTRREQVKKWEPGIAYVYLATGTLWWLIGGIAEIVREVGDYSDDLAFHGVLVFLALSAVLATVLRKRLVWQSLRIPALLLLMELFLLCGISAFGLDHPLQGGGYVSWPLALLAHLVVLRRFEGDASGAILNLLHGAGLWLLSILGSWELYWLADSYAPQDTVWAFLGIGAMPILLVFLAVRGANGSGWPLGERRKAYLLWGSIPLLFFAWWWSVYFSLSFAADPDPWPYIPIANPLDLVLALGLLVAVMWYRTSRRLLDDFGKEQTTVGLLWVLSLTAFVWLNASLARTVHFWTGVPYEIDTLMASTNFQTALTIFWAVLGVTTMVIASRRGGRIVWIAAAALLGLTVVKLFAVDLSSIGAGARIVTFLVVGVLLLLVGYFAPVPPERPDPVEETPPVATPDSVEPPATETSDTHRPEPDPPESA